MKSLEVEPRSMVLVVRGSRVVVSSKVSAPLIFILLV